MNIKEVITQPEGRRLEFKETMPERADLSKTVIAFANDAGGDLYICVRDNPRELIGLPEMELVAIEEQISNIILKQLQIQPQSRKDLKEIFGLKKVSGYLNRTITKLQSHNLIAQTILDNPNHPGQKFRITERGILFIKLVEQK